MAMDDVELIFDEDALGAIADKAIEKEIGARGLRFVMENIMTSVMFAVPSDESICAVRITADCVKNGSEPEIIRNNNN